MVEYAERVEGCRWTLGCAAAVMTALACEAALPQCVENWPAPAFRASADAADETPRIEARLLNAASVREAQRLAAELLERFRAEDAPALSAAERERVAVLVHDLQAAGLPAAVVVGRYNILICPEAIEAPVQRRAMAPFLDLAYVLLKRLFQHDPVADKGSRIIHRIEPGRTHGAVSNWSRLDCRYGLADWNEWVATAGEWAGNPIHEMTHCFAGNAPARFSIESLPGSGEGWPKWTPLYGYSHFPQARELEAISKRHREAYQAALREHLKSGDFWSIPMYDPSGGLLVRLGERAWGTPDDPTRALRQAIERLNASEDDLLGRSPTLSLLRFLSASGKRDAEEVLSVLRRHGCGITMGDVEAHRRWCEVLRPGLEALRSAPDAAEAERRGIEFAALVSELGRMGPLAAEVADGGLAAAATTLRAAGWERAAEAVRDRRPMRLRWRFLAGFRARSWGDETEALNEAFVNETAREAAAIALGREWTDDPNHGFDDIHRFDERYPPHGLDVAYAMAEFVSPRAQVLELRLSADDVARVWVNGELAGEDLAPGGIKMDIAQYVPVRLEAGRNLILVKVVNRDGPWGFGARLGPARPK